MTMFRVRKNLEKTPLLKTKTVKSMKAKYQKARMLFAAFYSIFMYATPVFASQAGTTTAATAMGNLLGVIAAIFRYVGIALFAWGAIQFILATKRSDGDSKADAIQTAMCGIALMLIKTILGKLGLDGISIGDPGI